MDLSRFKIVAPTVGRYEVLYFRIMADGELRMGSNLQKRLMEPLEAKGLRIRISGDGLEILLEAVKEAEEDDVHRLTKAGITRAAGLRDELTAIGIKVPARYEARFIGENGMWLGAYDATYKPEPAELSPKVNRPRTKGLRDMI